MKKIIVIGCVLAIGLGIFILITDAKKYNDMNEEIKSVAEETKTVKYLADGEVNTEGIVFSEAKALSDEGYLPDYVTYTDGEIDDMKTRQKMKKVEVYEDVLTIPSLGIKAPILEGIDEKTLWKGACHYPNSAKLGDYGNCVIAAHGSSTYKYVFSNLKDIQQYADVHVWDADGKEYIYTVTDTHEIYPSDIEYLYSEDYEHKYLTLFTCINRGTQRFVVQCKLFEAESELDQYNSAISTSTVDAVTPLKSISIPRAKTMLSTLFSTN